MKMKIKDYVNATIFILLMIALGWLAYIGDRRNALLQSEMAHDLEIKTVQVKLLKEKYEGLQKRYDLLELWTLTHTSNNRKEFQEFVNKLKEVK